MRTRLLAAVVLAAAAFPLVPVVAQKDTASGTKDASALLAENMWAAQTDGRSVTLVWNHIAGVATYTMSCEPGTRPFKVLGSISGGVTVKDPRGLPRRLSYVFPVHEMGAVHRCYLQWASDAKGAISARIPFNEVIPVAPTPLTKAPPASVSARASGPGEITLTWSEVSGATAYTIGRAVSPGGFGTLCYLCPTGTSFVDRAAQAGARHTYSVTPITPAGALGRGTSNIVVAVATSDEVIAGSDPTVNPKLEAPVSVKATLSGAASVLVTWAAVNGAAGYDVFRSANGGSLQLLVHVQNGARGSTIEVPDYLGGFLASGSNQVTAQYAVKSTDAGGAATAPTSSNAVTIDNKAGVAAGTTSANASNPRATATSAGSVTLTWSPPAGGIACSLRRSLGDGGYAALPALATGTSQYIDAAPGLLDERPRYRIACGDPKAPLPAVSFPDPVWGTAALARGTAASTSATMPANLRTAASPPDSVRLTWGPPLNPIACAMRQSLGGGAYATLQLLPVGAWHYIDTSSGLLAKRPRYQLSCGDPKSPSPPVAFPIPK